MVLDDIMRCYVLSRKKRGVLYQKYHFLVSLGPGRSGLSTHKTAVIVSMATRGFYSFFTERNRYPCDERFEQGGDYPGRDFSTWNNDRKEKYGFIEGRDFQKREYLSSPNSGSAMAKMGILAAVHP